MIKHLTISSYLLRTGIVLAVAFLLLGVATGSLAATDAQCASEWNDSDADDTCSNEQIRAVSGNRCHITATCPSSSHQQQDSIYVPLTLVSNLKNCGGWLTLGSC